MELLNNQPPQEIKEIIEVGKTILQLIPVSIITSFGGAGLALLMMNKKLERSREAEKLNQYLIDDFIQKPESESAIIYQAEP